MPIDLDSLGGVRTRWVPLTGPVAGVEILVQYMSPDEGDRFLRRLRDRGLLQSDGSAANGRTLEYWTEFCKAFVKDIRGDVRGTYDPAQLARAMLAVGSLLHEVREAVAKQDAFFANGGDGSTSN
jgi:hypothetical protein